MSYRKPGEPGQGLVEYGLILTLVAISGILTLNAVGYSLQDVYAAVAAALGQEVSCALLAGSGSGTGNQWDPFSGRNWKGGVDVSAEGTTIGPMGGALLGGYSGSDYNINLNGVSVNQKKNSSQGYGVTFRSSFEHGRLSGYSFNIYRKNKNDPGTISFNKWVGGNQIRPSISSISIPAGFDLDSMDDLSIDVSGDTFTAYFKGEPILSGKDSTFTDGQVGVYAEQGSSLSFKEMAVNPLGCQE